MTALTRSTNVTRKKRVSDYHVDGHTIKPELHSRIVGYRLWLLYASDGLYWLAVSDAVPNPAIDASRQMLIMAAVRVVS